MCAQNDKQTIALSKVDSQLQDLHENIKYTAY